MRTVAGLLFPGFELLDLFGPLEMLGTAEQEFSLELIAQTAGPVASAQQVSAMAQRSFDEAGDYDILLIPGGMGTRQEVNNTALLDWLVKASSRTEWTLSVCTGSALLARAGLLDGRRATTNKAAFAWASSQGPDVQWVREARWVEDGRFMTSSGVSAGMDMALAAIARMLGEAQAEQVAIRAEYTWQRDSTHDPFARIHGLV